MSQITTQFYTATILDDEPGIADILSRLSSHTDSFFLTNAGALPGLFVDEVQHLPVLFLSSKRLKQLSADGPDTSEPHIVLGDYDPNYFSSCYLQWQGAEFCIAIDITELFPIFFQSLRGPVKAFVVWVTDSMTTISHLTVDEDFVDLLEAARRACSLPRLVTRSDTAKNPYPNQSASQDVQYYTGFDGLPVYMAESTNDPDDGVFTPTPTTYSGSFLADFVR